MRVREIYRGLLALTLISLISVASPAMAQAPLGEADSFLAALHDGDGSVAFRYRFEYVDQDGLSEQALASTLRTAIRYQTMQYWKLDYFLEMTNVADLGSGPYSLPPGGTNYPVVADPLISRVNQSWLRWSHEDGSAKGGRQELVYDNSRFVGNVGWRQTHQVFDSVRLDWTFADRLDLRYTFVGQAHLVAGAEVDLLGHAVNAAFDLQRFGSLAVYAYLWDFADMSAWDRSTNTFGGFWNGNHKFNEGKYGLKWRAEYALQQDAYDNTTTIDETYMHFMAGVGMDVLGLSAGYEVLSGTVGEGQFSTVFATAHKFNGWADKFLGTPDAGLVDLYISLGGKWEKLGYVATWHQFDADGSDDAYGTEIDAQVTYKFDWGQSLGLKGAFYTADTHATDTTKMWVFTTFTF